MVFGYRSHDSKLTKAKLVAMAIAFVVVGSSVVLLRVFYGYISTDSTIVATVEEFVLPADGSDAKSKEKRIKTDKGILVDVPMPLKGKYDTPYYDKLVIGQTYEFKVSGKHIIGTDSYPLIISVKSVDGAEGGEINTIAKPKPAETSETQTTVDPKPVETSETQAAVESESKTNGDQQTAENFYNSANQYYSEGNYEKAVEYYKMALEILPDNINIQNNLQAAEEKLAN